MSQTDGDTSDDVSLNELVAGSLDAEPELLSHLPALMQDLEDLGARSGDVIALLEGRRLGPGSRVLDLRSGKGASAIAVAKTFGATVDGVDAMPEFVDHARQRARSERCETICTFEVGDLRETVRTARDYDLLMLLAVGPVFGEADETRAVLRECVRPGGLVLIDDAYLADGAELPDGVHACYDRAKTVRLLESHGDRVIDERVTDTPESEAWCRAMTAEIVRRAHELSVERPELAVELMDYAERQQRETEVLCGPLVGALWLVEVRSVSRKQRTR